MRNTEWGPTEDDDEFVLLHPRSDQEVARLRQASVVHLKERFGHEVTAFTCDGCVLAPQCLLAFDGYNTDGDCLLSK